MGVQKCDVILMCPANLKLKLVIVFLIQIESILASESLHRYLLYASCKNMVSFEWAQLIYINLN
jgi:hypothetical protein